MLHVQGIILGVINKYIKIVNIQVLKINKKKMLNTWFVLVGIHLHFICWTYMQ